MGLDKGKNGRTLGGLSDFGGLSIFNHTRPLHFVPQSVSMHCIMNLILSQGEKPLHFGVRSVSTSLK